MQQDLRLRAGLKRSGVALAALLSLLVAGCGSTVQVQSTARVGTDGLAGSASTTGSLSGPSGGTGSGGTSGAGTGATQGTGAATSGASSGQTAVPEHVPGSPTTPRVSSPKAPVKIGVITQPQLESAASAIGLDGVTTGDTRKQVDAVLAWVRANGGLGGHPVQVYEHAVDLSDGSSDLIQTKACAAMAQDYKVHFVVTVLGGLRTLTSCLAKYGIGLLADNATVDDRFRSVYASTLASPSEAAPGRLMRMLVDHLVQRRWLTSASKIGIFARDDPTGRATVEQHLKPALRRHGLTEVITEYVDDTKGDGGSGQSGSAVLRFRAAGVDRFIPAFYSPLYFMLAAERQQYYPAYTISSNDAPGALIEALAPPAQLRNSVGMGWQPFLDIGKGTRPGPVSARQTLCFDLMRKAGQAASSALVKGFQAQVCDLLFYLKDLSDRRPDMPLDLLTSGRKLLGSSFVSPATYRVDVTNRSDGMAGFRPLAYLERCECFEYVGSVVKTS